MLYTTVYIRFDLSNIIVLMQNIIWSGFGTSLDTQNLQTLRLLITTIRTSFKQLIRAYPSLQSHSKVAYNPNFESQMLIIIYSVMQQLPLMFLLS